MGLAAREVDVRHEGWDGIIMCGKVHAVIDGVLACDGKTVMRGFLSEPGDGKPFCRRCGIRLMELGFIPMDRARGIPGPSGFSGAISGF